MACYADKQYKCEFVNELVAIYDTRRFTATLKDEAHRQNFPQAIRKHLGWWVYIRYRFRKYKQSKKQSLHYA